MIRLVTSNLSVNRSFLCLKHCFGFYLIFCDKQSNSMDRFCLIRRRMKVCLGDGWIWMLFRVLLEVCREATDWNNQIRRQKFARQRVKC
ncbi:uncharacterized protein LOC118485581 isoform X2 [Helianthus annuus]|uniref:uncharacterized protein LOC118485581 isoform X2 n=2 Tax=Helianthus annuus TaxID=4232 RepID=UPI001652EE27|nr:uncharacterized protein LOC118485581 isoform X2 [Helianthus annuus]